MKPLTLLKNIIFSLVVFAVFLLLLEGIFRLARKEDALRLSMGRVDAKYHHIFEPHSQSRMVSSIPGEFDVVVHINNEGFRGPDMSVAKQAY